MSWKHTDNNDSSTLEKSSWRKTSNTDDLRGKLRPEPRSSGKRQKAHIDVKVLKWQSVRCLGTSWGHRKARSATWRDRHFNCHWGSLGFCWVLDATWHEPRTLWMWMVCMRAMLGGAGALNPFFRWPCDLNLKTGLELCLIRVAGWMDGWMEWHLGGKWREGRRLRHREGRGLHLRQD